MTAGEIEALGCAEEGQGLLPACEAASPQCHRSGGRKETAIPPGPRGSDSLGVEQLAWRLAVLGVMLLALLGAAGAALFPRRAVVHHTLVFIGAKGVEQKFYDGSGAYWQAPGRGISASELWGSCEHAHLHSCDGYCCCDKEYYWKSPKTVYQEGKAILKKARQGASAAKTGEGASVATTGEAIRKAAESLGKAAIASLESDDQRCVPKSQVPEDVVQALSDSDAIPGSEAWLTCSASTSNSHTCGEYCCCDGGFRWSASDHACLSER